MLPSPSDHSFGDLSSWFSKLNTLPVAAPVYASDRTSRCAPQDSRSGWIRCSFPVGLFHSLLHAGLSRRTVCPSSDLTRMQKLHGLASACQTHGDRGRHDFQSAFGTFPARALLRATGSIPSPEMANPPIYAPLRNTHRRPRYGSAAWKASSAMAAGVVPPNRLRSCSMMPPADCGVASCTTKALP